MVKKLFIVPYESYNAKILGAIKESTKDYNKVCYISLNKTHSGLSELIEKQKMDINKFYFIDSVTPSLFRIKKHKNCTFIEDPSNLEKSGNLILNTIKTQKSDLVIIDSVSSLLVYKSDKEVMPFLEYLLSFLEEMKIDVILFALKQDINHPCIGQIEMRVDETKKLEDKI
jgi:archaellum biogenesis ATPase FlaH